eukprot:m.131774 g.131774  ORF g.131774 m.131774 type:complete len:190 (+) comp38051_c0_seq26:742-1311(+)
MGKLNLVCFFLRCRAWVNAQSTFGESPLHLAAFFNHITIAQILLRHSSNVHLLTKNGRSPLHWAAKKDHAEMAKLLVKHGALTKLKDGFGATAFSMAFERRGEKSKAIKSWKNLKKILFGRLIVVPWRTEVLSLFIPVCWTMIKPWPTEPVRCWKVMKRFGMPSLRSQNRLFGNLKRLTPFMEFYYIQL